MYGPDTRTIKIMLDAEKRPVCAKCGNKVDMALSNSQISYFCGCNSKQKVLTIEKSPIISDYVHQETVFK